MLLPKTDMITDNILGFIRKENMLRPGDTVVCGLSGGADSVCLLLAMKQLSTQFGITVEALHVNHCLRGDESDRDEAFCRKLCADNGIPFRAFSCNVRAYAAEHSLSDEEAARKLRYGIFADNSAGKLLATAHNADDNLETMILNLARGSALKGICGIPPVRGNIIRPLLCVSRAEIEAFLAELGQDFVTDSTNLSDDYTRNKIRHRIVPQLKEINPSVTATSVRSAAALREENALIEAQTDAAEAACLTGSKLTGLAEYDKVIRKRCIARLLTRNSLPYSSDRLETADSILVSRGKLNISGNIYFVSDGISAGLQKIPDISQNEDISAELRIGANCIFPGKELLCEIVLCDDLKKIEGVHNSLTSLYLDYDKIIGRAIVRNRRFGDKIRLSGRNFTSSVKKLINEKIPAEERPFLHFIEDEEGTVYAEKIGISDRVKPDRSSRKLLKITVRNTN